MQSFRGRIPAASVSANLTLQGAALKTREMAWVWGGGMLIFLHLLPISQTQIAVCFTAGKRKETAPGAFSRVE